ncbi:MAG: purine-nucleoside phosphorylase [Sphaerochaetaceae bacterium]|jgi:purine-nucleoside phosphorylase
MTNRLEKLQESSAFIQKIIGKEPLFLGIILGSGLGDLAEELLDATSIPYNEIPHFPDSSVSGHKGRLVAGVLSGKRVLVMQGRIHLYEGYSMRDVVFPVQVMHLLGIKNLMVTNAAGCVNSDWKVGDLMLIKDHIKLSSDNPLRGYNDESIGPRFFDMSEAYSQRLRTIAKREAKRMYITLREGVYQLFTGPSYETPAEIRLARLLGADAVGMSTVPEVIAARHSGMEVLGISCLTNMAAGIIGEPLDHEEVLETGKRVKNAFSSLVRSMVATWEDVE